MKPLVTYVDAYKPPEVGREAFIRVVDHPRHPAGTWVITSPVLSVDDDGMCFETRNSKYRPGIIDDSLLESETEQAEACL
jgi:hypothetical protein